MTRSLLLSLSVLILSMAGCQTMIDVIFDNDCGRDPPKRRPGMTDDQYEYAREQHRVNEAYRDVQKWDNEHYMRKFGRPLHPNVSAKPYKDERTIAEQMSPQTYVRPLPAGWLDQITTAPEPEPVVARTKYDITPW